MPQSLPRIVLAENEAAVAKPLVAQLQNIGHDITWVDNVRELRDVMEVGDVDVLILANTLDTDGLEYLQSIRFAPHHPRGGVIVISDSVSARERGLQLGAAAALPKPLIGDDLLTTLAELLALS